MKKTKKTIDELTELDKDVLRNFSRDLLFGTLFDFIKSLDSEDIKNNLLSVVNQRKLNPDQFMFLQDSLGLFRNKPTEGN
jgi:hypothetical protein